MIFPSDASIALNTYSQTIERLSNWTPPLKLTFRAAPSKKGYLMKQSVHKKNRAVAKVVWKKRFFTLSEGTLIFSDSDAPSAKIMGEIPLMGGAVNLVPFDEVGRNCCFKVLSGVSQLIVQADTVNEMFDWASSLYYGMALANGGGYVLAMEVARIAGNKSRQETEAGHFRGNLEFGHYSTYEELAARQDCPVCYNGVDRPVTLKCGHIFCEHCIYEWLDKEKTCPVCRAEVENESHFPGCL